MENKGFEKKTSGIMHEFKLNPSDAVWQHVARTIRKRKRRRFFAWLFPSMLLAGGGIGWLIFFQSPSSENVTEMNTRMLSMKKVEGQDPMTNEDLLAASPAFPSMKKIQKKINLADGNTRINQRQQMSEQEKNTDPIEGGMILTAVPTPSPEANEPSMEKIRIEPENLQIKTLNDHAGSIRDFNKDTTGKPAPPEHRSANLEKPGQMAAGLSTTVPSGIERAQKRKTRWSVNIAAGSTMLRSSGRSVSNGLAIEAGIIRRQNRAEGKFHLSYGLSIGRYESEGFKKSRNELLLSGGSMNASQPGANLTGQDAMDRRQAIAMMSVPVDLHLRLGKKGKRPAHLHTGLWNGYIIRSGLKHVDPVTGVSEPDLNMHDRLQTGLEAGFSTGMLRKKGYPLALSIQYRHGLSGLWKQQASMDQKISLLTAKMTWEFGRSHPSSTMNGTNTK